MRGYSINNYLNFNTSYKFTINYILVDYNVKQINKSNQHKLNKDLIRKEWDMVYSMLLLRTKYLYETNTTGMNQIGIQTEELRIS
jgi:predicted kinase